MVSFFRASLLLYLVGTGLGVVLRYAMVSPVPLNFGYSLHAHSHTLYFGWAGLALFALFFDRVAAFDGKARACLWSVVAVSVATFVVFMGWGYTRPGVIVSVVALVAWASAIAVFLRRARGHRSIDVTFLRVAVVYVGLAGASALARVVILVLRVEDPLPGRLAVFGFLHCFAAFFTVGVMGLWISFFARRGVPLDRPRLRLVLGLVTPLSALTFPLGVVGGMDSPLGPTARIATVLLAVANALWLSCLWPSAGRLVREQRQIVRLVCVAWGAKTVLEVAGAAGLADLAAAARHPAILYLHVTLLGVVTASLLFMVGDRLSSPQSWPLFLHFTGLAAMVCGLALTGIPAMFGSSLVWGIGPGLWLAGLGGLIVVAAAIPIALEVLRRRPAPG